MTFLKAAMNAQRKARGESQAGDAAISCVRSGAATSLGNRPRDAATLLNVGFSGGGKKRMEILQMPLLDPKCASSTRPIRASNRRLAHRRRAACDGWPTSRDIAGHHPLPGPARARRARHRARGGGRPHRPVGWAGVALELEERGYAEFLSLGGVRRAWASPATSDPHAGRVGLHRALRAEKAQRCPARRKCVPKPSRAKGRPTKRVEAYHYTDIRQAMRELMPCRWRRSQLQGGSPRSEGAAGEASLIRLSSLRLGTCLRAISARPLVGGAQCRKHHARRGDGLRKRCRC